MKAVSSTTRRKALRFAVAALAAPLVARSPFASAADAALTIGLLRNPVSGLITLTNEKGWFKAAGVELQPSLFTGAGGPKVIQAMGGGSLALGSVSATAALLALSSQAVPLRIVSISTDPAPVFVLMSAPEITTVPQLAGKRVATTAGTGLQYFLASALRKHGMKMTDIEFVNLPVGDAQAAFLAKRVDAVVPSLNGRYFIRGIRAETRELFTWTDFTKPPGPTTPFEDYDVFIATQSAVETSAPALRAFFAAYHGRGVPYLLNPATQNAAISEVAKYVNAEQKGVTDEAAMRTQLLGSRFFDLAGARAIMKSDAFRAGLEDQVRYFVDSKQIQGPIALEKVIVGDLLG